LSSHSPGFKRVPKILEVRDVLEQSSQCSRSLQPKKSQRLLVSCSTQISEVRVLEGSKTSDSKEFLAGSKRFHVKMEGFQAMSLLEMDTDR